MFDNSYLVNHNEIISNDKNIIKKQSSRRCLFYCQLLSSNKLRHAICALPIYITYIACVVGEIKLHVFEILGHYSIELKLLFFSSKSKGMILFPTNNNNRYIHLTYYYGNVIQLNHQ